MTSYYEDTLSDGVVDADTFLYHFLARCCCLPPRNRVIWCVMSSKVKKELSCFIFLWKPTKRHINTPAR